MGWCRFRAKSAKRVRLCWSVSGDVSEWKLRETLLLIKRIKFYWIFSRPFIWSTTLSRFDIKNRRRQNILAALRIPAVFIALCFFTQAAFPQELPELYQPKVKINITADRAIENEMRSYISRELRTLPNVKVVSNDFDWELQIVAIEAKVSGQNAGVVASVVIWNQWYDKHTQ